MRRTIVNTGLVIALFYLFVLQVQAIWSFTIDDMYISLRYAKHWVAGHGLVWNVGEPPVEGYSNFSFVVLARLALFFGFDPVVVLKGAGVFGLFCTSMAVYFITRMWFLTYVALIPCLWLLAYKGQILWSVSGLETTVYQALICSAVFFIFSGLGYSCITGPRGSASSGETLTKAPEVSTAPRPISFIIAGILLALAGMTRPEAPALMILFVVLLFFNRPRAPCRAYWKNLVLFCCTIFICFAPYFFWRWHYYGRLFPNPVYCKGMTNFTSYILDKNYLRLIWPFALFALPAIWRSKDNRHYFLWLPSAVYLILLMSADPIVAFDNRLFLPAFILMLPLTVQGIAKVLRWYLDRVVVFNVAMTFVALLLIFFFIPMMTLSGYHQFTENPLAGQRLRQHVVTWLGLHTPSDGRVVLADSGFIPYQSSLKFIDSYCLNNAEMTKLSTRLMYQHLCETVVGKHPDVIILTSLINEGRTIYTPTDACLAVKLAHNNDYCKQASLGAGDHHSFYRYEIFSKSNTSHTVCRHKL